MCRICEVFYGDTPTPIHGSAVLGHIKESFSKIIPVKNSAAIKSLQIIKKQF